jgi:hypothetical protein
MRLTSKRDSFRQGRNLRSLRLPAAGRLGMTAILIHDFKYEFCWVHRIGCVMFGVCAK